MDYRSAIEEESAIADVAALQALIDSVDASLAAFVSVQLAATGGDASALTDTTFSNIRGLMFNNAHLTDYQGAIAAEAQIEDVAALQALFDSVDASIVAFALVQSAATNSDAQGVSLETLNTIRGLTFDPGHITDYQAAIASETEIADEAALQALLDSVDASLAAFIEVQAAATNNDAFALSTETLDAIRNLTHNSDHFTDYRTAIAEEDAIADVAALQALIDSVDASIYAFAEVREAALSSDASNLTVETLSAIRGLTINSVNFVQYQTAIEAESAIDYVFALQGVIDEVDEHLAAFAEVQAAATNSDASNISNDTLSYITDLTFDEVNLADYQVAIAGESEIADVEVLQLLIDTVDTSVNAFADVQLAALNNDASGISDSTLANIIGLTFETANLTDYQGAIAEEALIADTTELQTLLDSVDASVVAFATVQDAATNNDGALVSSDTLNVIRGLTSNSDHLSDYQAAIAEETSITDVTALQALIDSVDASLAAFASVQAAATNNNGASISIETLTAIRGLTISSANLSDYQGAIAAETAITDVTALQALIDSVDASINAFSAVQLAATNNDATSVTIDTLNAIRGLTING
ncbi:hypothetical protein, partial [Photobacterium leiognathi]|uniref:hypothetical protein n=1 Tax=Photobacterium leiognathi TaxID=553611 RepID=UPI0011B26929